MNQDPLWSDTLASAVEALAAAVGGSKELGSYLRPHMAADDAGKWLARALDSKRREQLTADDLLQMARLGRRKGCHVLASFIALDCGYEPPRPRELGAEIERVTEDVATLHARAMARIEQLTKLKNLLETPNA